MKIDWMEAPAWANYHAFDRNGKGAWHEEEPVSAALGWMSDAMTLYSGYRIPDGMNWKETLVTRLD